MADIEVSYENKVIKSLSASGQLVCHTAGKYCDDDITIDYTSPGGGGGTTVVASGTVTGAGGYEITIPIGEDAPIKNFYLMVQHHDTEFIYDSNYKVIKSLVTVTDDFPLVYQNTSGGEDIYYANTLPITVNDSGTITNVSPQPNGQFHNYVRQTSVGGGGYAQGSYPQLRVSSSSISIKFSTGTIRWASGDTYDFKLVYFGGDYANESISI